MFKNKKGKSGIDMVFLLVLFGVFAISGIFAVLFGAKIYKNTTTDMDENFTARTVSEYVTGKLQRYDRVGAVEVVEAEGTEALRLSEETEYGVYYTYLYYYDGYLREITLGEDSGLRLKNGMPVMELDGFSMIKNGQTYSFTATDSNRSEIRFNVTLRSGKKEEK